MRLPETTRSAAARAAARRRAAAPHLVESVHRLKVAAAVLHGACQLLQALRKTTECRLRRGAWTRTQRATHVGHKRWSRCGVWCLRCKARAALRRVPTRATQQAARTLHEHPPGDSGGTTSGTTRSAGALYAYASSATHADSVMRATVRLRCPGGPAAPLSAAVIVLLVRACAARRCALHKGWTGACCAQNDVLIPSRGTMVPRYVCPTTWSTPCAPTTWRTWSAAPSCRFYQRS